MTTQVVINSSSHTVKVTQTGGAEDIIIAPGSDAVIFYVHADNKMTIEEVGDDNEAERKKAVAATADPAPTGDVPVDQTDAAA